MGKITRALIKYNRAPNKDDRPIYHRLDPKEDEMYDDHSQPPFNMLSAIVVVLVVSALSLLSLNTIFFIHKGQKENARLAQSFVMQQKQIEQLTMMLGNRQESLKLLDKMKHTQMAFLERDAEWLEFAKNQYHNEIFVKRLEEDQNVMLEKMVQMNNAVKDIKDTLKIKEGK